MDRIWNQRKRFCAFTWLFVQVLAVSSLFSQTPNEGIQPAAAPAAPIRATPAVPGAQENPFATPATLPPQRNSGGGGLQPMVPNQVSMPQGETMEFAGGGSLGGVITGARLVLETPAAERVQVYPDDPESAWWEVNPSFAFSRAQREQRVLMVLFTGMWNQQAMSLSKEVFATKSFNAYAKEKLVICYLNYPKSITDLHRNSVHRRIKEKFKVRGLPNILLFTPDGEVHRGIAGYRSGRPVDYFLELKTACIPLFNQIETQRESWERKGFRDWSNYMGKIIFARFLKRDETHVALIDVSGRAWTILKNDLSPDDQRLAESFPVSKEKLVSPEEKVAR